MIKFGYKYILLLVLVALFGCKPKQSPPKNIDAWYKHLFIYNLDVKTFKDSAEFRL